MFLSRRGVYCFTAFLLRLLRVQARFHARFEGCPPGRLTATSESGVFVSALPARHVLAPHPVGGSPVPQLACVPVPSVGSLAPEYPWGSTLLRPPSTTRDTGVCRALVPSVQSRARSSRHGRSRICCCHGRRYFRCCRQLFARTASKQSARRASVPAAILQEADRPLFDVAQPASFGVVLGRLRSSRSTHVPVK
jgi:hypothetical protein